MKKEKKIINANNSMRRNIFLFFFLFSLFFLLGCNDPVFYELSTQIKIQPPRVQGSPTAFTEIDDKMYVASGNTIHFYDTKWDSSKADSQNPDYDPSYPKTPWNKVINLNLGRITCLSGTDSNLYIIADNKLYTSNTPYNAAGYSEIAIQDHRLLAMYSANNNIFLGSRKPDGTYSILQVNGNNLSEIASVGYGLLNGASYNGDYFFSVKDTIISAYGGIYHYNGTEAALIQDRYDIPFMGIVSIDQTYVYAIRRNGVIFKVDTASVNEMRAGSEDNSPLLSTGRISNGTLFVWEDPNNPGSRLLLAGRQDYLQYDTRSGYVYGYLEIELEGDGQIKKDSRFREPGVIISETGVSSTLERGRGHNDRYKTTLGTYPVKYIHQANDANKTLFASTHQNGVWSLRAHDKNKPNDIYWNTEE